MICVPTDRPGSSHMPVCRRTSAMASILDGTLIKSCAVSRPQPQCVVSFDHDLKRQMAIRDDAHELQALHEPVKIGYAAKSLSYRCLQWRWILKEVEHRSSCVVRKRSRPCFGRRRWNIRLRHHYFLLVYHTKLTTQRIQQEFEFADSSHATRSRLIACVEHSSSTAVAR